MELASFDEANTVLDKPADMTHDQCESASVCRTQYDDGTPVVISCWRVTKEELEEIQRTGRVWLTIVGQTMPPAYVGGANPFGK
jgi:hypothetical protein